MSPEDTCTHTKYFLVEICSPFMLLEPRRREMVGGQTLAPSQRSAGLVSTIGCADGHLPGNYVPKPPGRLAGGFPAPWPEM